VSLRFHKINDSRDRHDREVESPRSLWGWRNIRWYAWLKFGSKKVQKETVASKIAHGVRVAQAQGQGQVPDEPHEPVMMDAIVPRFEAEILKGWWHLGSWDTGVWRWHSEFTVALGGEDNMLQLRLGLPFLFQGAIGVRVPRRWTDWVYQRREWGVELRGLRPVFRFAYDDDMSDMRSYYIQSYREQGKPLPEHVSGAKLWVGWELDFRYHFWPRKLTHWKRRMLGPPVTREKEIVKSVEEVTVWLPEGAYPGRVELWIEHVRFRFQPWRNRDDYLGTFYSEHWLPFPGKGENSWDCGDDGFKDLTINAVTVGQVVTGVVSKVIHQRERYGRYDWQPEGIGVMR